MTDDKVNETAEIDADAVLVEHVDEQSDAIDDLDPDVVSPTVEAAERPQYGVGPFSIREVALGGVWLVAFIVSFFSVADHRVLDDLLFGGSVWANGLDWILTIGVPTIAVFLIVLRRFSPDGIRRVGSLGVDQFASVAFSVSAVIWLTILWRTVGIAIQSGVWIFGWVVWVEFFLALAGVVLTVFAPIIPMFSEDFAGRREVVAHRNARPIRPVSARPPRPVVAPVEPEPYAAADAYDPSAYGAAPDAPAYDSSEYTDNPYAAPQQDFWVPADEATATETAAVETATPVGAHDARQQAFWALAPEERDVVDERGATIFRVGPTAWALVLEDRGEAFVIRHEDGRVGYLHDTSGVTRG